MNKKAIGRAVSVVVVFTMMAKLLGFFREILLSYFFGASGISDAYLISQNIPGVIFQFVGTGLLTCFIPVYFQAKKNSGKERADAFTNMLITAVLLFSTMVIVLIWLFTPDVIKVFAAGFEGQTITYATWFTRIGVLSLYFSTIIYVYNSYLQANSVYGPSAFAAIPNNLCIMLSIAFGASINIWLLPIGSCLAVGAQMLFLIVPVHKHGFHLALKLDLNDRYLKMFIRLVIPTILGVSVNQINTLVDRTIASQVAVGGISALTYANSLIMLVQGGLVDPINTVFYPQITEAVSNNNTATAKSGIERVLNYILTLLIPITAGFVVFRNLIIEALFVRGVFDSVAAKMTSDALSFYAIGLIFIGIREMLSRFYYAHSYTKIPMRNSIIGVMVNVVLNLVLGKMLGIAGLALSTAISAQVTAMLLWLGCDKHLKSGHIMISLSNIIKTIVATVMALIPANLIAQSMNGPLLIKLIIIVMIASLVYCTMAVILRIELAIVIVKMFKDKI